MDNSSEKLQSAVWLAEGQSSQRDMLESLQTLKAQSTSPFTIIASHRQNRPEIFEFADKVYHEPVAAVLDTTILENDKTIIEAVIPERWSFVLEHAKQNRAKVLLTGRNGIAYEAHREAFIDAGIRLLTGATSVTALETINDKFVFMQHCHTHNIPVAQAWRFDNVAELKNLLAQHGDQPLCVKPVTGIFAQGFWKLDSTRTTEDTFDSFEHLYFTDNKKINTEQFINAYANSQMVKERPIPMLLMPYLAGREYSIDVICENGEVLAAITRYKTGKVQHIGYDESVMAVVIPLIRAFGCDGIVSVQTKQNNEGQHCVLEINSRPSGGIGYTKHSGVDLTQIGFGYWLGLTAKPKLANIIKQIEPCQVRSIMTSVRIEGEIVEESVSFANFLYPTKPFF